MRRSVLCAWALAVLAGGAARAQGVGDVPALLAAGVDQFGQGVGESALGGSSVFVTAKGVVKAERPVVRYYRATVSGEGSTAVEAARVRDAKIEKLRAAAKRFNVDMTLGVPDYTAAPAVRTVVRVNPQPVAPGSPLVLPPGAAAPPTLATPILTARTEAQFVRPAEASMPAFMDALREAGVDAQPANPLSSLNAAAGFLGIGGAAGEADQAAWGKAGAAAVAAAREEAEALAAAAGRKVGQARQITLLSRTVQGDQLTVWVAVRFAFAD